MTVTKQTYPNTCPQCNNTLYSSSQWSPFSEMCYRCEDDLYSDSDMSEDYDDSMNEEDY